MKHTRTLLTTIFLLSARLVSALTINADIIISPNPSPYLSDWQSRRETAMLIISHDGSAPIRVQLRAVLRSLFNGAEIVTAVTTLENVLREPSTYTAEKLFPASSITYDNSVGADLKRTGRIPEGDYELCVYITPIGQTSTSGQQTVTRCREFALRDQTLSGAVTRDSISEAYSTMIEEQRRRDEEKKAAKMIGGTTVGKNAGKQPSLQKKKDDGFTINGVDLGQVLKTDGTTKEFEGGHSVNICNDSIFVIHTNYNPRSGQFTYDTLVTIPLPGSPSQSGALSSEVVREFYLSSIERPDIGCDSLTKLCDKIENLFWGKTFSLLGQSLQRETHKGGSYDKIKENAKTTSFGMENGWVYDCKTKSWEHHFTMQCHDNVNGKERSFTMTQYFQRPTRWCP